MSTPPTVDCESVIRVLFTYLDGELVEEERQGVDEHLARCRSCFSRAEFERRLKAHLGELGRERVPPPFEERVRSLIGQFGCD
jgi:anti-sigma factor (TIGR02949 family)